MGCDCSKPGRTDVPQQGMNYDFDVRPVGDKLVVYDGQQSKWFEVDTDEHLRRREQITAEHYQLWKTAGQARMHGPLGRDVDKKKEIEKNDYDFATKEGALMTIEIGPAGFAAIDDDNHPLIAELWKAWVDGEEDEKITWACERQITIKTKSGRVEADIKMVAVGQSRCKWKDIGGKKEKKEMWSKFHKVEYTVNINGKPLQVVGEHLKNDRYAAQFQLVPGGKKDATVTWEGCDIETHMLHGKHCVIVKTGQECLPLGALCIGMGMSIWCHPVVAEKHAEHFAWEIMREKLG